MGMYLWNHTRTNEADGITICGRQVYTLDQRWGFGLLLSFGILVLTLGTFAPGVLIIYPIVEYAWLKKEELRVPFGKIRKVAEDSQKQRIAIEFEGNKYTTPIVIMTPRWHELQAILKKKVSLPVKK